MHPDSTAIFAQRVRRRAARNVAVVGVVTGLAATGFAAAVHCAGAVSRIQSDIVSVDDTYKGEPVNIGPNGYLNCFVGRHDNTLAAANWV